MGEPSPIPHIPARSPLKVLRLSRALRTFSPAPIPTKASDASLTAPHAHTYTQTLLLPLCPQTEGSSSSRKPPLMPLDGSGAAILSVPLCITLGWGHLAVGNWHGHSPDFVADPQGFQCWLCLSAVQSWLSQGWPPRRENLMQVLSPAANTEC